MTSELPGFYKLNIEGRRALVAEATGLCRADLEAVACGSGLTEGHADRMVENALGVFGLPLGLCVNLLVNGKEHLVPMAVEEPSVVAASSHAAKLLRAGGGIEVEVTAPHMIGQIQVLDAPDPGAAEARILAAKGELVAAANAGHPALVSAGGGAFDVEVRHLPPMAENDPLGPMLVVHLIVDVKDAMGANAINTMCERLAPRIAELSGGRTGLRILSNLSDRRLVRVVGRVPFAALDGKGCGSGEGLARAIEAASVFAERDPYRAATHNKGVMNGIDAALIALGQDWRAIEAGAHAYAARNGRYTAMSQWRVEGGALVGRMELPMAVGTVGGVVNVHPTVKAARKIARIDSTAELAAVIGAVGLAQNLSALRALSAEGIQSGHMRLHARNVVVEAGALPEEVEEVACAIADAGCVNMAGAARAIEERRARAKPGSFKTEPSSVEPLVGSGRPASEPPASARVPAIRPPSRAPRATVTDDDRAFCDAILPKVSRTFALSIQALPQHLRDAICAAYLLCRVVDTIEDEPRLDPKLRGALFDRFDEAMTDDEIDTIELERGCAGLGGTTADADLVVHCGAVFRLFRSLPATQRDGIRPSVLEMSSGMRAYCARADQAGKLRLTDLPDLERYCHYVAGTVGSLLTALFLLEVPNLPADARRAAEERAESFGLGLQLVNIVKDIAGDFARGDCYLPENLAKQHGLSLDELLEPGSRRAGIAVIRAICARAREHLVRAEEYTLLWPAAEGSASSAIGGGSHIRLFCAVPLALALATLREVEAGDDTLRVGRAPSVSRATVFRILESATRTLNDDDAFRSMLDAARCGGYALASRPPNADGSAPSRPGRPRLLVSWTTTDAEKTTAAPPAPSSSPERARTAVRMVR